MSQVFVFEGLDYTGKTTVSEFCHKELSKLYPGKVVRYRNPGGTPLGEKIRDIARIETKDVVDQTFAFFLALSNVRNQVAKDVNEGKIVLLDRWFPSLWCYQLSNIKSPQLRAHLESIAIELSNLDLTPDLVYDNKKVFVKPTYFMFRVSPAVLEERIKQEKNDTVDRFQAADVEYRKQISDAYSSLITKMKVKQTFGAIEKEFDTDVLPISGIQHVCLGEIINKFQNTK